MVRVGETRDGIWDGGGIIGAEIFGMFPMDGEEHMILSGIPFGAPPGDGIIGDGEVVSTETHGVHHPADFTIDLFMW